MAVQGRGYYGIGASKKDFGFSNNMTLPLSGGYGWSQGDAMPTEGRSDKGHASFTVDKQGKLQVEYGDGKKGKSWRKRLSGFFKREKKAKESEDTGKGDEGSSKRKGKTKASEAPKLEEDSAKADAQPADDVNNAILNQEGLTTAEDDEYEEGGEQEEEDDDMVVATEVEVVYHEESGDESNPRASLTEDQEFEEDLDPDMESNPFMIPAAEMQENEEEIGDELEPEPLDPYEEDIGDEVEPEILEKGTEKIDQTPSPELEPEVKPVEKTPPKQKKRKKKTENRKSAALEVSVSEHEKQAGKKNGKTKKQRPKSMPMPTLELADEQDIANDDKPSVESSKKRKGKAMEGAAMPIAPLEDSKKSKARQLKGANDRTNDRDMQEAATLTETQSETKKTKAKKANAKKEAAANDMASTESPTDKRKKSARAKQKSAPLEETFDSPPSPSPPPEEDIVLPKQVTVGVIKIKNKKTRPFLDVGKSPRSKVYQSDPTQEDGEDDPDAEEERELIHEMDTLRLMAGEEEAKSGDKKARRKKQGKRRESQDTADHEAPPAEVTKAGKKSKQAKSKGKSVAEPEPMSPQTEVVKESKDEKQSKVAKKTKAKGKAEPQSESDVQPSPQPEIVAELEKKQPKKKSKSGGKSEPEQEAEGQQTEAASKVGKKQPKKKAKSKEKDDELQASPPKATPEPDKKKTKKTKSKEVQPPSQEAAAAVVAEPDKKQPGKVKKTKSKGKAAPEPEPEAPSQSPPPKEPESGKKKSSKKSKEGKGKEKTDTTDAAAVEHSLEESETPKKKKKKISKASIGTPDSPSIKNSGSSSTRSSRSQLVTKASKSKNASEATDDLEWVGPDRLHKKTESEFKSKDDSAIDEELLDMNLSSSSRSTSYHELSKEDRKTFQEELRKASSQHSVDATDDTEGGVKVEIDPNVKVTKSGVVKGGKGSRRPSLQVFDGGIEQTDSASPNEADRESGKKISMDLSAVPQTTPSLGLEHGHDKVDLVHRSSVKRRPMSQRESVLLTDQQKTNGSGAGLNSGQGTPTSIARQLFSRADGEPQSGEGSATSTLERSRRNKTVDKPVKMLGIASDSSAKSESDPSVPSWVALAKNKQKRSSQLLADKKEVTSFVTAFSPTPVLSSSIAADSAVSRQSPRDKDDSIPKIGTVQARLAAFQRK